MRTIKTCNMNLSLYPTPNFLLFPFPGNPIAFPFSSFLLFFSPTHPPASQPTFIWLPVFSFPTSLTMAFSQKNYGPVVQHQLTDQAQLHKASQWARFCCTAQYCHRVAKPLHHASGWVSGRDLSRREQSPAWHPQFSGITWKWQHYIRDIAQGFSGFGVKFYGKISIKPLNFVLKLENPNVTSLMWSCHFCIM